MILGRMTLGALPRWVELDAGPTGGEKPRQAWVLSDAPWRGGTRVERVAATGPLLAPVEPTKIVCIGRNYAEHAAELGNEVPVEPLLFLKPPSALLDPGGTVELPAASKRVEHEVELGVVVGQRLRRADEAASAEAIWGYTVVADVTARDLQRSDKTWTRGKGFDTFCPTGPVVVSDLDVSARAIRCHVNDELRQDGTTADMLFPPSALLSYISHVMTLEPGDLVATGTPSGVGPLCHGDRARFSIDGIGELDVLVR